MGVAKAMDRYGIKLHNNTVIPLIIRCYWLQYVMDKDNDTIAKARYIKG